MKINTFWVGKISAFLWVLLLYWGVSEILDVKFWKVFLVVEAAKIILALYNGVLKLILHTLTSKFDVERVYSRLKELDFPAPFWHYGGGAFYDYLSEVINHNKSKIETRLAAQGDLIALECFKLHGNYLGFLL